MKIFAKISMNILLLCCFFNISHAQYGEFSKFTLSGYGTLSYTVDDRSDMAPMRDFTQRPDDDYKTGGTWKLDSRLALQGHYRFAPTVDFVVQGVLRDQVEQSFANSMELAYVGWRPHAQVEVRAGRLSYDAFMMSDTRNLGYAYLWVRPPTDFYGWAPIFSVDGGDITYTTYISGWQIRLRAQGGVNRFDAATGDQVYSVDTSDWSAAVQGQSGPWRIKAGFTKAKFKKNANVFEPLREGLGQISSIPGISPQIRSEATFLRDKLAFKDMDLTYITLGAAYDDGTWVAQAEISKSDMSSNLMPHGYMGYIGAGRRFGNWTPYFLFAFARPSYDVYEAQSDWSPIRSGDFQNTVIQFYNMIRTDQETYSLGMRWDFHNQAALKLQWDHSYVKPYYGLWSRKISTSQEPSHINQCTLSLEFVF